MSETFIDRAEQAQRRAADPGASVWVGASAGTGKTKVLTDRVLTLLLGGTPPERILCLTFTKAAAAEMANRIAGQLSKWTTQDDDTLAAALTKLTGTAPDAKTMVLARRLFARVLDTPGGMHIQTIHSFCQSLLGRFPLEAEIAPHFSVMDDRDARDALADAQETVLMRARAGTDDRLAQALAVVTEHVHETAFGDLMGLLANARSKLQRLFEREGSVEDVMAGLRTHLGIAAGETVASLVGSACEDTAFDGPALRQAAAALETGSKTDVERGTAMSRWLAAQPDQRIVLLADYQNALLTAKGEPRKTLATKKIAEATPGLIDALTEEANRLAELENRKRTLITLEATDSLLVLGDALIAYYRRIKESRAQLDYDDLILKTRDLLTDRRVTPWVLYKLDGGLDHILVDEAQDTSPDQWRLIQALAEEFFHGEGAREETRTVFAVGDVKQSIYSFQGADPQTFEDMRHWFQERVEEAGCRWEPVQMTVSFRSTQAVLAAVDAIFAHDREAARGVALDGQPVRHDAMRLGPGKIEIWPPVVPAAGPEREPWKPPVEPLLAPSARQRLAALMAKHIERMVGKEALESQGRPIEAGDILVLVRRRDAFVEELVRALKQLNVPVAGVDRMVLTEQLAVMDLIALGRFLLLPEDDLTLATVLKSPLIGLTEEQLFTLAYDRPGSLFNALAQGAKSDPAFRAAYEELSHLLALTDRMPPFELYTHILSARGGRKKLFARLGPEAEDPLAEFIDLAAAFEQKHVPSLEGFLHWLEASQAEIKRDLEHGGKAVRVMTVHGAKGLQAPIVFLPDTLQIPTKGDALLWGSLGKGREAPLWPPRAEFRDAWAEELTQRNKDKTLEEYRRLLYVALTRAEDRLIVCGWQTSRTPSDDCWLHQIRLGLTDIAETRDDPFLAEMNETDGAGVLVLENPGRCEKPADRSAGTDPSGDAPLPDWAALAPRPEDHPVRPLTPSRPDEEPPARSPLGTDDGARFRRGRLIHRLLETLPNLEPPKRPEAARRWLALPTHGLEPEAQEEIARETLAVLDDPRFAEIFTETALAEAPLAGEIGGTVIAGQVDRLVVTKDAVLVVDYKTNRPPPEKVEAVPTVYFKQMAAYRALLQQLYPAKTIRCALLWTDGPRLMELPSSTLNAVAP